MLDRATNNIRLHLRPNQGEWRTSAQIGQKKKECQWVKGMSDMKIPMGVQQHEPSASAQKTNFVTTLGSCLSDVETLRDVVRSGRIHLDEHLP